MEQDKVSQADDSGARPLNVPAVASAHYSRNLIRNAVCELRFPTIFEIEDPRPPSEFWHTLRKDFPNHSLINDVQVGPASLAKASVHQFTSRNSRWTVVLKSSSISLETSRYDSFEEFAEQLKTVLTAATSTIDSDFFTRIGLRYINVLPCSPREVDGWVNPSLAGPLVAGFYGDVEVYAQQIRGVTGSGGYLFQHGLSGKNQGPAHYLLDYDFYQEEVMVKDATAAVRRLHELEFSLFYWSLGDRARQYLAERKGQNK
ncbi:TIGR04255 family protein [Metallibacterium sp.]|uniref:TIGR04255 family protein n=1 Tax=Metallibacterium sp. TaxID=2940281 RepID=UPI002631D311|nr:TIGR04255 family protein [Metallibacterium sp.]